MLGPLTMFICHKKVNWLAVLEEIFSLEDVELLQNIGVKVLTLVDVSLKFLPFWGKNNKDGSSLGKFSLCFLRRGYAPKA